MPTADQLIANITIPAFAIPLIGVAFLLGFVAVPRAVDALLRYKRKQLSRDWYASLAAFTEHDLSLWLGDEKDKAAEAAAREEGAAEREFTDEERALRAWALRQRRSAACHTLDRDQVAALRKARILAAPADWYHDELMEAAPSVELADELYSFKPGIVKSTACGLVLAAAALICSVASNPVAAVSGFAALALMETMMITDLRVKLIPFETTAAFWVLAVVFGLASGPVADFGAGLAAGAAICVVLMLADFLCRAIGGNVGVGMGDLRLLPAISIFSGLWGTVIGFVAASFLSLALAVYTLAFKGGNRKTPIPYAPGLCLWAFTGLFTQVVACV